MSEERRLMARCGLLASPTVPFIWCLVVFIGCSPSRPGGNGSEHGNPSDAGADGAEPDAQRISADQLDAFSASLTRWWHSQFDPPLSLGSVLLNAPIVISGELVSLEAGRKEFLIRGCDKPSPEGSGGPCLGNPDAAIYASYVNMRIQTHRVWKGALPNAQKDVNVEHPWPNNEPTEELARSAPRGVRVIAFARLVENARELAEPLEEDGIANPEDVAANLLNSPPYGLIFESVDSAPILPLMHNKTLDEALLRNPDDIPTFDAVLDAISAALP